MEKAIKIYKGLSGKLNLILLALAMCFSVQSHAEEVVDYFVDYSTWQEWNLYKMNIVPQIRDGVLWSNPAYQSWDQGANDGEGGYTEEAAVWYMFFMAPAFDAEYGQKYNVTFKVKGSTAGSFDVNLRWSWGEDPVVGTVNFTDEWTEQTLSFDEVLGYFIDVIFQSSFQGDIEIAWIKVTHEKKESASQEVWKELLTNGDAENDWFNSGIQHDDMNNNYKICAWSTVLEGLTYPYPAPCQIEEVDGNRVFAVHTKAIDVEKHPEFIELDGNVSSSVNWANQFWIESSEPFELNVPYKVSFRYKASKVTGFVNTMLFCQDPYEYSHWSAIGDVVFTEDWQRFEKTIVIPDATSGRAWSIAFSLGSNDNWQKDIDFYFDDLSVQTVELDHGYFVAGVDTKNTSDYDFGNATEMVWNEDESWYEATIGTQENPVNQIMLSTVRGNDYAFKAQTLYVLSEQIVNDPEVWVDYYSKTNAKLNLPGTGIWKICIDPEYGQMTFQMLWGEEIKPIEINPNPEELVVHAVERDWLPEGEEGVGTGSPWDNQFWIKANRQLQGGEETYIEFEYKATKPARTSTQYHRNIGEYLHWLAIGDVNFTTEWQKFEMRFVVPTEANNMQSIEFNLAEIKDANDYHFRNIVWRTADSTESLIDQTGTENFYVSIGAGAEPVKISGASSMAYDIPSGVDIASYIAEYVTEPVKVLTLNCEPGGSYRMTSPVEIPAGTMLVLNGNNSTLKLSKDANFVINDGLVLSGFTINTNLRTVPLIQMGENPEVPEGANAKTVENPVTIKDCRVNWPQSQLYSDGGNKWILSEFNIDNSVFIFCSSDSLLTSKALIDALGYGIVSLSITNSTFANLWAQTLPRFFVRYSSSARAERMGVDMAYVTFQNNTFYNIISENGQMANYTGLAAKATTTFTFEKNIFYGVRDVARRLIGGNVGSANVTFFRNTYMLPDGGFDNVSNYDKSETELYCDSGFANPENMDFTVNASSLQAKYKTGDPRWLVKYIPENLLYVAKAEVTNNEEWASMTSCMLIDPVQNIPVEVYDDKSFIIRGMAGVEGYDLKVTYDDNENVTSLTPILSGEEGTETTSGYVTIYAKSSRYFQAYVGEGFCFAGESDGEGYVLLTGYDPEGNYGYYYLSWPIVRNDYFVGVPENNFHTGNFPSDLVPFTKDCIVIMDRLTEYGTASISANTFFAEDHLYGKFVVSSTVATNKMSIDLSNTELIDSLTYDGFSAKWGVYGKHLNSLRIKGTRDMLACYVLKGTKLWVFGQNHSQRHAFFSSSPNECIPAAGEQTASAGNPLACFTAAEDQLVYIGSVNVEDGNPDYYISYIIAEVPEDAKYVPTLNYYKYATIDATQELDGQANINLKNRIGWIGDDVAGHLTVEGTEEQMLNVSTFKMTEDLMLNYEDDQYNYGYAKDELFTTLINNRYMRADSIVVENVMQPSTWNFVTLPFDVKVRDIKKSLSDGTVNETVENSRWVIRHYNGANRASASGSTWENYGIDDVIPAGQAFILHHNLSWWGEYYDSGIGGYVAVRPMFSFPALNTANKQNIFTANDVVVPLAEYESEFAHSRSWNHIGNPYPSFYDMNYCDFTAPITLWRGGRYMAFNPIDDECVLYPFEAIFLQRPVDQAEIVFRAEGRQHNTYIRQNNAPRKARTIAGRDVFNLTISDGTHTDNTRFVINKNAAREYELSCDAAKFFSDGKEYVELYTVENGMQMAINERPISNGVITLGTRLSNRGTYTISLNSKSDMQAVLIDYMTGARTQLNNEAYTFSAEAGSCDGRFEIMVGDSTTEINSILNGEDNAEFYSVSGVRMPACPTEKGVYIVVKNGASHKMTIK